MTAFFAVSWSIASLYFFVFAVLCGEDSVQAFVCIHKCEASFGFLFEVPPRCVPLPVINHARISAAAPKAVLCSFITPAVAR